MTLTPEQARALAAGHLAGAAVAAAAEASPFMWLEAPGVLRSEDDRKVLRGALLVLADELHEIRLRAEQEHTRPTLPSGHDPGDTLPAPAPEPACLVAEIDDDPTDDGSDRPALSPPPPAPTAAEAVAIAGQVEPWLAQRGGVL